MLLFHNTRVTPPASFHHFMPSDRFISYSNPGEILLYTAGFCLTDGQFPAAGVAGCGFVYRPFAYPDGVSIRNGGICFRLETQGPNGVNHPRTHTRAELRAVIAALQCNTWDREGWDSLVIATHSEYVVFGITKWIYEWAQNGWITSSGYAVMNSDLWVVLNEELGRLIERRVKVSFWLIPNEWNFEANQLAKHGATLEEVDEFVHIRI